MSATLWAQGGKNGDGLNPVYVTGTRLFDYNYKPWIAYEWGDSFKPIVDTINLCRLRTDPVRTLTTYNLSGIDTTNLKREDKNVLGYDSLGNLIRWDKASAWFNQREINFDTVHLNCDSLKKVNNIVYQNRANQTLVSKTGRYRKYETYDANGYLIERREIKRGIFKKDVSPFRITGNQIQKFTYSDNYRKIAYTSCHENRARFDKCIHYSLYLISLDEKYNISRELYFEVSGTDTTFRFGKEFIHEYY